MSTCFKCEHENITMIPVSSISLSRSQMASLKKYGLDTSLYRIDEMDQTVFRNGTDGTLPNLNHMMESFKNGVDLPPVKLKLIPGTPEKIPYVPPHLRQCTPYRIIPSKPDTYQIVDGRHRVVASILNGYTEIPTVILKF